MSDTQALESFTQEELVRMVRRDRFVKDQQSERIKMLLAENLEMLAIIQELQGELAAVRQQLEQATTIPVDMSLDDVVAAAANNGSQ